MFELEREVRRWRRHLERGTSLSPRELDELEDHLRARVDLELELNPALTPAAALAVAIDELGEPKAISREFARAGWPRWRHLLLAGWAMYAASFLLPAYGYSGHDAELTTYGYEIAPELVRLIASGPAWVVGVAWLPNLIMLMTLPAFRRPRPSRRAWTAWIVGATGGLPLILGLVRFGDPGAPFQSGTGFWVWSASFVVVAAALWLRGREWVSVRPRNTDGVPLPTP